jgi:hypothetical protein
MEDVGKTDRFVEHGIRAGLLGAFGRGKICAIRKQEDPALRVGRMERLDQIEAISIRQVLIDKREINLAQMATSFRQGASFPDHLNIRLARQEKSERLSKRRVVVDKQ